MGMKTAVEVRKDGTRVVYHERTAPPDKRAGDRSGAVTHAWNHAADEATRKACAACQEGKLPPSLARRTSG